MSSLMTTNELLTALKRSRTSVYRLMREGMPCVLVGKTKMYDLEKVMEWLQTRTEQIKQATSTTAVQHGEGTAEAMAKLYIGVFKREGELGTETLIKADSLAHAERQLETYLQKTKERPDQKIVMMNVTPLNKLLNVTETLKKME